MQQDSNLVRQWSHSAPYWEKHQETVRNMFAPITEALVEDAGIIRGHHAGTAVPLESARILWQRYRLGIIRESPVPVLSV